MKREELLDRIGRIRKLEQQKHEEIITELYDLYIEILEEEEGESRKKQTNSKLNEHKATPLDNSNERKERVNVREQNSENRRENTSHEEDIYYNGQYIFRMPGVRRKRR